jgi:glyoxylase-like metal-dependent hydrolase (beta-lactamase superfamily II)
MRTAALIASLILTLAALAGHAQDGKATLDTAARALGATNVASIQYSGTGFNHAYGQAYAPGGPWPAFKVTTYAAIINYNTPAMRVELDRTNPDGEIRGGGGLPLLAPQKQVQAVSGNVAWNVVGQNATMAAYTTASPTPVTDRLLNIWKSPHGVVKAAQNAGANTVVTMQRGADGRSIPVITFPAAGLIVKATLNADYLVERVETRVDDPVLGEALYETVYAGYRDFGGVTFPTRIVQNQGGYPVLDLTVTDVRANPNVPIDVPQNIQQAAAQPPPPVVAPVTVTKLGEGIFFFSGQAINSAAVEFKDHIVVIESPQDDGLASARFEAIHKTIPNKPIKYVVNTHHHNDHLGGLRNAVAEGAIIITQAQNREWYEKVFAMPRTIAADRLARAPRKAVIETVGDKRVLTDGVRRLELHRLLRFSHVDTMLMAYLPKEKILIQTDAYNPTAVNAPPPSAVSPLHLNLYNNIQRLRLDVAQIVPLHGPLVTIKDLQVAVGKTSTH